MAREINTPNLFPECNGCPQAMSAGRNALDHLGTAVSNPIEIVCAQAGGGRMEMTAKPSGVLIVDGNRTSDFSGVLYRAKVDCPGIQSNS